MKFSKYIVNNKIKNELYEQTTRFININYMSVTISLRQLLHHQ